MKQMWWQAYAPWASVSLAQWRNWQWQIQHAARSVEQVNAWLSADGVTKAGASGGDFSVKVTPHMAAAALHNERAGLEVFRRAYLPMGAEQDGAATLSPEDGIGEELSHTNPVLSISHFYPDRALFRVVKMCAGHCRYCFRRRMIREGNGAFDPADVAAALDYLRNNQSVREVVLSGGDPLVLGDRQLSTILESLASIPHIKRLRIDTKALFFTPDRFTAELIAALKRFRAVYIICHFTHAYELTPDVAATAARMADAGLQLRSHTPLLRGINDAAPPLAHLFDSLVDLRIQPYHLIHFIPTPWTEHFRVPFKQAMKIYEELQSVSSGLALPSFVVYLPNGNGKVCVSPERVSKRPGGGVWLKSVRGNDVLYEEPLQQLGDAIPA